MSVGLYRSYAALLVGALVPIWTGSHASLVVRRSAIFRPGTHRTISALG